MTGDFRRFLLLFVLLPVFAGCRMDRSPTSMEANPKESVQGWSLLREDFPGSDRPPAGDYAPMAKPDEIMSWYGKPGSVYWYRVRLPETFSPDSALFIAFAFLDLTVYLENRVIHGDGEGAYRFDGLENHLILLPEGSAGKDVYLRVRSPGYMGGLRGPIFLDSYAKIIRWQERFFGDFRLAGVALILMGFPGFLGVLNFRRVKIPGLLSFALFSLFTGFWFLLGSQIAFLGIDPILRFFLISFFFLAWPLPFVLFYKSFFGSGVFRVVDYLFYLLLLNLVISAPLSWLAYFMDAQVPLEILMNFPRTIPFLILILVLGVNSTLEFRRTSLEHRFLFLIFFIPGLAGGREILGDMGVFEKSGVYYHYAVLLFVFSLGLLMLRRVIFAYEQFDRTRHELTLAEKALGRAQVQSLQDRMNPHFILNSLSVVYSLLESAKMKEAMHSLILLTEHYRYLTDRSFASLVPLGDELNFSLSYMELQQIRFADSLQFESEISPDIPEDFLIPPLCIQPLLENSLKHGIRKRKGAGKIKLTIEYHSDGILDLRVEDDGPGPGNKDPYSRSLGNIQKRLSYHFEQSALVLKSGGVLGGAVLHMTAGGRRK